MDGDRWLAPVNMEPPAKSQFWVKALAWPTPPVSFVPLEALNGGWGLLQSALRCKGLFFLSSRSASPQIAINSHPIHKHHPQEQPTRSASSNHGHHPVRKHPIHKQQPRNNNPASNTHIQAFIPS